MANRTCLKAQWAKFHAHQNRDVEVLVFFVFDDFANARLADFVVNLAGIEQYFRLDEKFVAKSHVRPKLGAEFATIHTKIEVGITIVTNGDIIRVVDLCVETTFQAEAEKLSLNGIGKKEGEDCKNQIFHVERIDWVSQFGRLNGHP